MALEKPDIVFYYIAYRKLLLPGVQADDSVDEIRWDLRGNQK
jgi:hypothetical protein